MENLSRRHFGRNLGGAVGGLMAGTIFGAPSIVFAQNRPQNPPQNLGRSQNLARTDIPHLATKGTTRQLIVNGRPMLLMGGELGNSSASSRAYMAPYWSQLKAMGLNTVITPVYWELVEPTEGHFDFSSLDWQLEDARANGLKLVILWFGAWKNSMSTYCPAWVKRDGVRFPKAQLPNGLSSEILSAFGTETLVADARAFGAMMAHLAQVDASDSTVVMVQIENEIGMLPVAREYGPAANRLFASAVPNELMAYLAAHRDNLVPEMTALWAEHGNRQSGTWQEVFGESDWTAEIFQAWHYARFANGLCDAGKRAFPLPMYVNVALNRIGRVPGEYPSGGPLPHLIDVWKAGAPSIDILAPDIYFPSFVDIISRYHRPDNPLFIPEANNSDRPDLAANALYAYGEHDSICFSPFSIESVCGRPDLALADAYHALTGAAPTILDAQGTGRMRGFKARVLEDETVIDVPSQVNLGPYRFTVHLWDYRRPKAGQNSTNSAAIIIHLGGEDYLMMGRGTIITMRPLGDGPPLAGIDVASEGTFTPDGTWVAGRVMNGDQTHQGRHINLMGDKVTIQRVKLYRYR